MGEHGGLAVVDRQTPHASREDIGSDGDTEIEDNGVWREFTSADPRTMPAQPSASSSAVDVVSKRTTIAFDLSVDGAALDFLRWKFDGSGASIRKLGSRAPRDLDVGVGDRLVSLNGIDVLNKTKDEIMRTWAKVTSASTAVTLIFESTLQQAMYGSLAANAATVKSAGAPRGSGVLPPSLPSSSIVTPPPQAPLANRSLHRGPVQKRCLLGAGKKCPKGHSLVPFVAFDGVGECDMCDKLLPHESQVMSCTRCDYDLCSECVEQIYQPHTSPKDMASSFLCRRDERAGTASAGTASDVGRDNY